MLENTLQKIKNASIKFAMTNENLKNKALLSIADALNENQEAIISANQKDLLNAENENIASPLLKRLKFDKDKINGVIQGIHDLIKLEDPVNKKLDKLELDNGLILQKISVPIGVIGVIFESRPDALVQIATLCIKSGNAAVLKGGSEAIHTNRILTEIIQKSISKIDTVFNNIIHLIETREDVKELLQYDKYINLIIPRGSNAFVQYIQKNSMIPVMGHADGICHLYIDKDADIKTAVDVAFDSKTQYVAVCNAIETLLVHKDIANEVLPAIAKKMKEKNVLLKGCEKTVKILTDIEKATDEDWATEYLDYILSIKIVSTMDEAVDHINLYGSHHTDVIITKDNNTATVFQNFVDSASVLQNCSSRFADGFRYGMGAEVGISTNKIHARGPVGLDGLIIYKYLLNGNAHIVDDYASGKKTFTHKKLS